MKFPSFLPATFSLLFCSHSVHAMDYDEIVEHVYHDQMVYSSGVFSPYRDGSILSTQAQRPQKKRDQNALIYSKNSNNFTQQTVLKRIVPGQDGRERISNTTAWPYSIHAHLNMLFNGKDYGGSATIVGPHHLLTCAHCVYDFDKMLWAEKISVYPALNETMAPFGELKVTKAYTFRNWLDRKEQSYDLAILLVDQSIGDYTGWGGLLCTADADFPEEKVNVTGYPGDKGFKQMWSMSHKLKGVKPEQFDYEIDTAGGQSGSAIWINKWGTPMLLGVHTQGSHSINSGVRFSGQKFINFLIKIITETYTLETLPTQKFASLSLTSSSKKQRTIKGVLSKDRGDDNDDNSSDTSENNHDNDDDSSSSYEEDDKGLEEWRQGLHSYKADWGWAIANKCWMNDIVQLELFHQNLGYVGARALAKGPLLSLIYLNLSDNSIRNVGTQAIAKGKFRRLQQLDLSNNDVGEPGALALATGNLSALKWLSLSSNNLGPKGALALVKGNFIGSLTNLNLNYNKISDEGIQALAKGFFRSLTTLELQENDIGDKGVLSLSRARFATCLTSLNLSCNKISDEGAQTLAKGKFKPLRELFLYKNQIHNKGAKALSMGKFKKLWKLRLCDNHIGDEGAQAFLQDNLPSLYELSLLSNPISLKTYTVYKDKKEPRGGYYDEETGWEEPNPPLNFTMYLSTTY